MSMVDFRGGQSMPQNWPGGQPQGWGWGHDGGCGCGGNCNGSCGCGGSFFHRKGVGGFCSDEWFRKELFEALSDPCFAAKLFSNPVVAQAIANGLVTTATFPSAPMKGVTDGSKAAVGIVGEVLFGQQTGTMTGVQNQQIAVSTLMLPAGEWAFQTQLILAGPTNGAFFELSPLWASNLTIGDGGAWLIGASGSTIDAAFRIFSAVQTAWLSQPQLCAFNVMLNPLAAITEPTDANWTLATLARRVR